MKAIPQGNNVCLIRLGHTAGSKIHAPAIKGIYHAEGFVIVIEVNNCISKKMF